MAVRDRINANSRKLKSTKKAVRPLKHDGYVNLLTKYGTKLDVSEAYQYQRDAQFADMQITEAYEGNGLFSVIIDTPAEEAVKHGFELGLEDPDIEAYVEQAFDALDWEDTAAKAIKWARLYGGAIIVMLIDDGGGLDEAVNWENVKSIDELRVFERPIVQPDYTSLYRYDLGSDIGNRTSKFGQPEYYDVFSRFGTFRVHETRCLVLKNGELPEQTTNSLYQLWGIPEYNRIRQALKESIVAQESGTKLLERSVQPIYKMKGLASMVGTDDGEKQVLRRLQTIDTARSYMNTIVIDAEGEEFDFRTFQFTGVKDVMDGANTMLSGVSRIPQSVLYGKSTQGMSSTDDTSMENYYNFIERIQKLMLRKNMVKLLDVVFQAGLATGEIQEIPDYKLTFSPLWSLSDTEEMANDKVKADTSYVKAQTAQAYVTMQALDPSEVRKGLGESEEFSVENLVESEDIGLYDYLQLLEEQQEPEPEPLAPPQETAEVVAEEPEAVLGGGSP